MTKDSRDEMTASEVAMRKFLKQLGVTAHQELAAALAQAVADGKLLSGAEVAVTARVEVADLQFTHDVTANLVVPE
ncbi:MAG: hypothetical protein ISP43_03510 [Candidatus Puniceispirillum sp.]|nr:hypothetical protein [Candidatus Puniceispirillum sp.]MBL6775020.1 hypothetical protein [Candidatus Puniceispirillum sp.]